MSSDFHPTCWLCARQDRNGTERSCMDSLQLYGSSSWKTVKIRKGNLSLFPNGPVYAVIFVNDLTNMNQKDGHWAMTGSVFVHLMRNRDDLCIVVKWCGKKNTITRYSCSGFLLLHKSYFQHFLFVLSRHLMLNDAIHRQFLRLNNSSTTRNILCWLVKPATSVYLSTALSRQGQKCHLQRVCCLKVDVIAEVPLHVALCCLAQSIQVSQILVRNGWIRHLVHVYMFVPVHLLGSR